jgi:hypothetical protein
MAEFNTHKWFKNQYLMRENDDPKMGAELEAGLDGTGVMENKSDLYSALSTAIPEDTNYKDFAKAIAKMLIDDYGSHNFSPFMKVLHAELGMNESLNEAEMVTYKVEGITANPDEGGPDEPFEMEVKLDASLSAEEVKTAIRDAARREQGRLYKLNYTKA